MKLNKIKTVERSDFVNMGPIRLRQPLPTQKVDMIDPFILLHHYGPYNISPTDNPFDLGPHPHRGFEPVTFLLQGEQLHRDSLGHESVVKAGDVQWTTAGRGIIHAEGPTESIVENGGTIEGIQLWLNLPADKKMIPANYQHARNEDFEVVKSDDGKSMVKIFEQVPVFIQTILPVAPHKVRQVKFLNFDAQVIVSGNLKMVFEFIFPRHSFGTDV